MITNLVMPLVLVMLALSLLLGTWRLLRGPALADRVLALDTLYINALALLVVLGMRFGSGATFEVVLLIGLLGFVGTVVLAKFLIRGDIAR